MSVFAQTILDEKYAHTKSDGTKETWPEVAQRVVNSVMSVVPASDELKQQLIDAIAQRKFLPGGRYLYASGNELHQVNNCLLLKAEDTREGWADLLYKASMSLMTGAGIGTDYSGIRPKGAKIAKTGGYASGPLALMQMVNESGRFIRQGGNRRAAIWAGLNWKHPDIFDFINLKDWSPEIKALKAQDYNAAAPLDNTNVSVLLDDEFFLAMDRQDEHAVTVFRLAVESMLKNGEPGFSIDCGPNKGETLRNACTEVTSADDSDVCNLASINLARIESQEELEHIVNIGTAFLVAGTVYSDLPYAKVHEVREKNRRLGLGLMGIHEWLIKRGKPYAPDGELAGYLEIYASSTEQAEKWADQWNLSRPVKTRAIAPTGTIGIIAETTTGIEPIFCVAYKRRYLVSDDVSYQYVIDPTAKRLIEQGVEPTDIEDATTLANDVERRLKFQAWVQQYVDHGISSTINLPAWGHISVWEFGHVLLKYLPKLRGVTVYPDGARSGQPLTAVPYTEAVSKTGQIFIEATDVCEIGKGESCGA